LKYRRHVTNFKFVMQLTEQKIWSVIKSGRQGIIPKDDQMWYHMVCSTYLQI